MTRPLYLLALLLCVSAPALAQESGQTGLTIGFPGAIGIIWHASAAVAVRPDFTFSRNTSKNSSVSGLESTAWTFGGGLSALFYTGRVHDNVRTYFSPRFGYSRTHSDNGATGTTLASSSRSNTYQYSGSFGLQYTPVRRFAVYGEAGIQYSRGDSVFTSSPAGNPSTVSSGKSTGSSVGTRAGIGLVWYFE